MIEKTKIIFKNLRAKFIALSRKQRNIIIFCAVIFSCFILALIISAVDAAVNENYFFVGSSIFFQDVGDVFMDFFNVNYFVQDMDPYVGSGSSYPPMVLLFAKFFQLIQGNVDTTEYIQLTARGIISLILYLAIFAVCAWLLLREYMKRRGISLSLSIMLYAALGLTAPMLYAIDRGNYLLYTFLFIGYFLLYFRSNKRWQRELSYISLALAVSFKLYPAIFALLMLNKKEWLALCKTAAYSVILLILPLFAFEDGFGVNLYNFISNLLNFESQSEGYTYLGIYFLNGYHNNVSLSGIVVILSSWLSGVDIADIPSIISTLVKLLSILVAVVAVVAVYCTDKQWVKVYLITSVMTFIVSTNYEYNLIFFIYPLLMFLTDDVNGECGVKQNYGKKFYISCITLFTLIFIPLPLGYFIPKLSHSLQHGYPVLNLVQVAAYLALTVVLMVFSFKEIKNRRKSKSLEKDTEQALTSDII